MYEIKKVSFESWTNKKSMLILTYSHKHSNITKSANIMKTISAGFYFMIF
jgi:hypothetical protein